MRTKAARGAAALISTYFVAVAGREWDYRSKEHELFTHMLSQVTNKPFAVDLEDSRERVEEGSDQELRPQFVMTQGDLERAASLFGRTRFHATHTAAPPTPLCGITKENMDPEIAADPKRVSTVSYRERTMADLLKAGAGVHAIYSESGAARRSAAEMEAFNRRSERFANLHPFPLRHKLDSALSGATMVVAHPEAPEATVTMMIGTTQVQQEPNNRTWQFFFAETRRLSPVGKETLEKRRSLLEAAGIDVPPTNTFLGIRKWRF